MRKQSKGANYPRACKDICLIVYTPLKCVMGLAVINRLFTVKGNNRMCKNKMRFKGCSSLTVF